MPATKKPTIHHQINQLWEHFRSAIDTAYQANVGEDAQHLRDFARNQSWVDALERLLTEETANERQHRNSRSVRGFSSQDAAKLIICNNVLRGSELAAIPSALTFISFRHSAALSNLVGYLVREHLAPEWKSAVSSLDYSSLMKSSEVR